MKTRRIILAVAVTTLLSCHRAPTIKALRCCVEDYSTTGSVLHAPAGSSVYQLTGSWTDQHDKQLTLNKLQGHPQIVAMIFTHCTSICPRIVEEMKAIRDSLPPSVRKNVGGVLVSFDPDRDTPEQLRRFAVQRLLGEQWELLHGSPTQVRELSMVLNVKYQKLSGGDYSHSGNIYILDQVGNIVQAVDSEDGSVRHADAVLTQLVRSKEPEK